MKCAILAEGFQSRYEDVVHLHLDSMRIGSDPRMNKDLRRRIASCGIGLKHWSDDTFGNDRIRTLRSFLIRDFASADTLVQTSSLKK